ncbi:MAG: redoxin domain-containing protein [Anaerolineae bacterium]|nr:redoxin domain-containing protein [Anaerolineae bacterium]NIN94900.1 redoxin domain-containing protein [Anaerolineae bacterium]
MYHSRDQFQARRVRVLVIGFEKEERARDWIRRAQVSFPLLIDLDRVVYRAYGIERSIFRSWHPRNLWFYFKRFLRGQGISMFRADPAQLGGDVLIDRQGRIRWKYESRDATDRPSVQELLAATDNL